MEGKSIYINLNSLNDNIKKLHNLRKILDKDRSSAKALFNTVKMSGETVESLKTLYAWSQKKTDSIGVLLDSTIEYLQNAEKTYREKDTAISMGILGGR